MSICLKISKVYGNGLALLGRLVMCTFDINEFTIDYLRLGL